MSRPVLNDPEMKLRRTISTLERLAAMETTSKTQAFYKFAKIHGLSPQARSKDTESIDAHTVRMVSELARRSKLPLNAMVRLIRGQTASDSRPNKQLFELPLPMGEHWFDVYTKWNAVVRHGVLPGWKQSKPSRQATRPSNHQTLAGHEKSIRRHIRKGQDDGRYLIVESSLLDQWPEIFISPIGAVDKSSRDEKDARLINDFSYPRGYSVNEFTERTNFPLISYNPPSDIARRVHELRLRHPQAQILLMLGDVSGAFRHVPMHEDAVHMFAFAFDGYVVIDLACGFGWCGSPAFYSLAGSIINHMYESSQPVTSSLLDNGCFVGNFWCDDHTCVEVNTGTRCRDANIALRRCMATVLGPSAINEKKFTPWSQQGKALGLWWNTVDGTVSIPAEKLEKAYTMCRNLLDRGSASKTELNKILGVFRHVATCFPPARSFYQRIHVASIRMVPFGAVTTTTEMREDITWFQAVITNAPRFNGIQVEQFASVHIPTIHVYMDASNTGLCALEPEFREYIRIQFTPEEQATFQESYSINVRELQSAVLAVLLWGPKWRRNASTTPSYVCFHIDNSSAVAWSNWRRSRNSRAQMYNRLLSLAEFQYDLACSAVHIPGDLNTMADAGSRAWAESDNLWPVWTNLSSSWTQVAINPPYDDLSNVWALCSATGPLQAPQTRSTMPIGSNGVDLLTKWDGLNGFEGEVEEAPASWPILPCTFGDTVGIGAAEATTTLPSN